MQLLVRAALILTATGLVVAATLAPAQASVSRVPQPDYSVSPGSHPGEYANRVVARINDARARAGLRKIRVYQTCLDNQSERWAKYLAQSGRLEHRNQYRVLSACNLHWTGETLARGAGGLSPGAMVRAWMHSPAHRAVLMKPRANLAGVAIRHDAQGRVVGVVNLGDPT
ncbi:MAG: CAP domain-containing protein [Nocardioides sp.]